MLKNNFFSKNKENNQTFSKKEYNFFELFFQALFEYINTGLGYFIYYTCQFTEAVARKCSESCS